MANQLLDPVFDGGALETNFFNGRVLTAEALQEQQRANRDQHLLLGRALGSGVVSGFELRAVTNDANRPELEVTAGLAISPGGHLVVLPETISRQLSPEPASSDSAAGAFSDCGEFAPGQPLPPDTFILVATALQRYEGKAPAHGLRPCDGVIGCGSRHIAHGVGFRLSPYPHEFIADGPELTLRSRIGFGAFGIDAMIALGAHPLDGQRQYGVLDALGASGALTDCDVPLGVLRWSGAGVDHIDPWSVRRPVVSPVADTGFPSHTEARRLAEAHAVFLHFQRAVAQLLDEAGTLPVGYTAAERLRFLPAAGYLRTGERGFRPERFFAGFEYQRVEADPGYMRLLVQQSFYMEPIDLTAPAASRPPLLLYESNGEDPWILFVRADRTQFEAPAEEDRPPVEVADGDVVVTLSLTDRGEALDAGWIDLETKRGARGGLRVWAVDGAGNEYDADPLEIRSGFPFPTRREPIIFDRFNEARFRIAELPAGNYRVNVRLRGYRQAGKAIELEPGETERLRFKLAPESGKPGRVIVPPRVPDLALVDDKWFKHIFPIEPLITYPWPPLGDVPPDFAVDPPPEEALDWFFEWGDYVRTKHPDFPVDPGDIKIAVDTTYRPDEIADAPYAYLVFGDGGAYIPAVLTATDLSFNHDVPLERGKLATVDRGLEYQLQAAGLGRLDALGGAWSGLFDELLGIGGDAGRAIVGEAQTKITDISGTIHEFIPLDSSDATKLANAGINSSAALANQTLAQLVELELDPGLATRLLAEARASVPREAWSIDSAGLSNRHARALIENGYVTKAELKELTEAARDELAGKTGVPINDLNRVVEEFDVGAVAGNLARERSDGTPLVRAVSMDRATVKALQGASIRSVADVLARDVDTLTTTLGGDAGLARRIIADATRFSGRQL